MPTIQDCFVRARYFNPATEDAIPNEVPMTKMTLNVGASRETAVPRAATSWDYTGRRRSASTFARKNAIFIRGGRP
jgi:hypothetical protein